MMPVNSNNSSEDYYSAYGTIKEGGGEEDSTCSSPQYKTSVDDQAMNFHTIPRPRSSISQLSDSLRDESNLPRHLSLETISDVLHHHLLDKPTLPAKHRPRRCLTDHDIRFLADQRTSSSFKEDFGHAAAETYLITQLSFKLLKYLGVGYRWMTKLGALGLYALFLMPGFLQVGYSYFYDKRIHRSIVYGQKPRNRLDLYLPENLSSPKPVVAFVTGGAWIIGYKAWGSLLGLQLVEKDVIVACIDYRNFPQGTISDMVEDVSQGISYLCNNIANYGGDPDRLYLAGQSAGAHLAACALVEQAIKAVRLGKGKQPRDGYQTDEAGITWKPSQFKAYFGISGGYNLSKLIEHFHQRGLYRTLFLSIMEGELSLLRYSPELRVQSLSPANASTLLPPFFLLHGSADYSIPCEASTTFASVLESIGVPVETKIYEGKTHTDLFLQDPMRGGQDELFEDILAVVHAGDKEAQAFDALAEFRRRLVPEFLLHLAHDVSPF